MQKYRLTFEFKKTETDARTFCDNVNKQSTYYIRKNKPAHYTPWHSNDSEYKFVCWYYI